MQLKRKQKRNLWHLFLNKNIKVSWSSPFLIGWKMKKIFVNLICVFIPFSNLRHKVRNNLLSYKRYLYWSLIPYHNTGKNNKIVIIKNGKRKTLSKFCKIKGLNVYLKIMIICWKLNFLVILSKAIFVLKH